MNEQELKHKGYTGTVNWCEESKVFHGKLQFEDGRRDVVLYEGATLDDLEEDFINAVDLYIDLKKTMKEKGI